MIDKIKNKYLLSIVLLTTIGILLRIYNIDATPPFDVDEYGIAYNAYSITTTGKDEWGFTFPLFFRSFGDYKFPLDVYLAATALRILGTDNIVFSLRLTSAIFGALYIPLMYLLFQLLTKNKKYSLFAGFLMTFSPFSIYFSRIVSGSISQSFFVFLSILCFAYFIKNSKKLLLIVSFSLLGLSLFTYPSSWIVAPALWISYVTILTLEKKHNKIFSLLFILFLLPIFFQFFIGGSFTRLEKSSSNSLQGVALEVNEFRNHTQNDLVSKFLHNKLTYALYDYLMIYVKHFDLSYLVLNNNHISHQHSTYAPIYFILIPFYYLGISYLFRGRKDPIYLILLVWILISPLASTLTGSINTKRYLTFLGSDTIAIVLGLYSIKSYLKKYIVLVVILLTCIQILFFLKFFFVTFRNLSRIVYLKGNILANFSKTVYPDADLIVFTSKELGEPQIYPLVALLYNPEKYIAQRKYKIRDGWYYIDPFDKFFYSESLDNIKKRINTKNKQNIYGLFSNEELNILNKSMCYQIISRTAAQHQKSYLQVKFQSCQ